MEKKIAEINYETCSLIAESGEKAGFFLYYFD
jgi:hypothetical protein